MTPLQYFKRFLQFLPELSRQSGFSVVRLFFAYVVCYLFHGANSEEFCALHLYEYSHARRAQFLLIRETERFSDRLNAGSTKGDTDCFDDKRRFNETFRDYILRDWLYMPDSTPDQVRAFLTRNGRFLAKDNLGTQGKSIFLYDTKEVDPDAFLREYSGKPFLLEAFITQHPAVTELNPSTVNTVRIQTIRKGDKVVLVGGCIRCGGADAFVDNFHQGGVAYPLDMDTGRVTGQGRQLTGRCYLCHPSSGHFMPGFQVPFWDRVTDIVRKAAVTVPHIGYVGWDVAITPNGPELVEGNINYPDPIVVQLDGRGVRRMLADFVNS